MLAGGNDPRCPKEEAQQVVDAVKKRGGVAEYKVYENEGHGFARVENQIDAYKRVSRVPEGASSPSELRLLAHRVKMWARASSLVLGHGARTSEDARAYVYFLVNFSKKSPAFQCGRSVCCATS